MTIGSHIESFFGLNLEQFDKTKGIQDESLALRIEVDYDAADEGETILETLQAVANDPKANNLTALIIGCWEEAFDTTAQPLVDFLVEHKDTFSSLKALFVGEMTYEENEISWINQANYSQLWAAYPQLEHLQIRGMMDLNLGQITHSTLETLIIETGGLDKSVVEQVSTASLPSLKKLELWLGTDGYGSDGSIDDVASLLEAGKFPLLVALGLKNSDIQDEIANAIALSPVLPQLTELDLSMGTLSDTGAKVLLENKDKFSHLKSLNLAHHYLSDDMMSKFADFGIPVDISDQEEADDDDDRYVEVAE
jgi:hypothetical protein